MPRLALLTLLLVLVVAAPAQAGGTLFTHPSAVLYGDAVLAGDRVVWATDAEPAEGIDFHRARPGGADHQVTHLAAPVNYPGIRKYFAFDASARRLAAGLHMFRCTDCKYQSYTAPFSRTLTGPLDGPLEEAARCPEGGGANPLPADPRIAVSGDVVASRSPCRTQIAVRDFGATEPTTREYPGSFFFKVAGDLLASEDEKGDVVVRDWRSGEERLRLMDAPGFDLQADGKLAFVAQRGEQWPVMWASPQSPVPQEVAPDSAGTVRIAGDRIAYARRGGGVGVRTVGGDLVAESSNARLGDFDGSQVAWAERRCTTAGVGTWDLAGEPPALPAGQCPLAALRSTRLRARLVASSAPDWVPVKILCPPEPPLGCEGTLALLARDGRPRPKRTGLIDFARGSYRLRPGERATVTLDFVPGGLCAVRRNGLRPIFHAGSHPLYSPPGARAKRRRVTLAGVRERIETCTPRS